jgi:hypothetical protein
MLLVEKVVKSRVTIKPLYGKEQGAVVECRCCEELCGAEFVGERILCVHGGRDEARIRKQEKEDKRLDQLKIFE